jgi:hypothetical protein
MNKVSRAVCPRSLGHFTLHQQNCMNGRPHGREIKSCHESRTRGVYVVEETR